MEGGRFRFCLFVFFRGGVGDGGDGAGGEGRGEGRCKEKGPAKACLLALLFRYYSNSCRMSDWSMEWLFAPFASDGRMDEQAIGRSEGRTNERETSFWNGWILDGWTDACGVRSFFFCVFCSVGWY